MPCRVLVSSSHAAWAVRTSAAGFQVPFGHDDALVGALAAQVGMRHVAASATDGGEVQPPAMRHSRTLGSTTSIRVGLPPCLCMRTGHWCSLLLGTGALD